MGRHLVLIGGGHAHLTALLNLDAAARAGHRATLVSASQYQYYSGMGPGMLSGRYRPEETRFNIRKMAEDRGAAFVQGRVIRIDPGRRVLYLEGGEEIGYDVASFNTGSDIPVEDIGISGGKVFTVKPIVNLLRARREIIGWPAERELSAVVAGGGPAGAEVAGNLLRLFKDSGRKASVALVAGRMLLKGLPDKVRSLARASLARRGARILEGARLSGIADGEAALADGGRLPADMVFLATGVRPSSLFRESGIPTGPDGGMLVNDYLQSVAHPGIFGGGDCISLKGNSLARVGVYAVRENPVLYGNLMAALEGRGLSRFDPGGSYLLILNMGDGRGIFWKNRFVMDGRPALLLKDYIDRRFMRKHQVSGELDEPSGEE